MRKIALTLIFCLISVSAFAEFGRSTSFDDREICQRDKGVWREFGNSAADNCESKMDRFLIAAQALTYACDCGKGRCWDGDKCVSMQDYKKIYEENYAKEQKKISEDRKKRESEYRDYSNNRLRDMISKASGAQTQSSDKDAKVASGNNLAQFADKVPTNSTQVVPAVDQNLVNNITQQAQIQAQNFANQTSETAKQVEQGPIGKVFSVVKGENKTNTTTDNTVQTTPTTATTQTADQTASGATPFFLQQQENAKKSQTTTTANNGVTKTIQEATSDLGLPQIPLPQ